MPVGEDLDYTIQFSTYIDQTGVGVIDRVIKAESDTSECKLSSVADNEPSIGISKVQEFAAFIGTLSFSVDDKSPVD